MRRLLEDILYIRPHVCTGKGCVRRYESHDTCMQTHWSQGKGMITYGKQFEACLYSPIFSSTLSHSSTMKWRMVFRFRAPCLASCKHKVACLHACVLKVHGWQQGHQPRLYKQFFVMVLYSFKRLRKPAEETCGLPHQMYARLTVIWKGHT